MKTSLLFSSPYRFFMISHTALPRYWWIVMSLRNWKFWKYIDYEMYSSRHITHGPCTKTKGFDHLTCDVEFLFKTDDHNQVERKAPFTSLCCLFIHSNFLCSRALLWKRHCQDTCLAFKVWELQSRDLTLTLRSNMNYSDVKHWSSQVIIKSRFLSIILLKGWNLVWLTKLQLLKVCCLSWNTWK